MKAAPVTRIEDAPVVCSIEWASRLLQRSVSDIKRDLALGVMQPAPMPDIASSRRPRKKQRRQWSRFAIEAWLRGGYLEFLHQSAPTPAGREFFKSATKRKERRGGQRLAISA